MKKEQLAQGFKMLQLRMGPENALDGLRVLMKGFDNVAPTGGRGRSRFSTGKVAAQQITGKDMSPEDLAQAIKYVGLAVRFPFGGLPVQVDADDDCRGRRVRYWYPAPGRFRSVRCRPRVKGIAGAARGNTVCAMGTIVWSGRTISPVNPGKWVQDYVLPAL
ncbi:MAG: hypothetical protein U5N27_08610 [Rhizobium sp.]|nr:hypothetical protein [Rhizobium sp.]